MKHKKKLVKSLLCGAPRPKYTNFLKNQCLPLAWLGPKPFGTLFIGNMWHPLGGLVAHQCPHSTWSANFTARGVQQLFGPKWAISSLAPPTQKYNYLLIMVCFGLPMWLGSLVVFV